MVPIKIPRLGLTMESATIVRWEFGSGESVTQGQTILVIETEKVTYEIAAPASGIIHPVKPEGTECRVEEIVGYIAETQEEYESLLRESGEAPDGRQRSVQVDEEDSSIEKSPGAAPGTSRIKASPLARVMAATHNIDLTTLKGSGPGGRIVRDDVLRAIEQEKTEAAPESVKEKIKDIAETIPIRGPRKTIFENMFKSITQSAQLTLHTKARAGELVSLRKKLLETKDISFNAILIKMAASALRKHPRINSTVEGNEILVWKQINIGLAMEAGEHLIVPVIKEADTKGIGLIQEEIEMFIRKIQDNSLSPDDVAGGTFTLTNLGHLGVEYFTPILRPPESAILGIGAITEVFIHLSLTFDHRIIDGAPAARFLRTIKEIIENPTLMLI